MRFGSVCSGIEAASIAWKPLGWTPAFFSEIDPFACAVLAHHYPDVPRFGDFRDLERSNAPAIDLLVGGTPCQDFSVAGLRAGMAGDRGALSVEFVKLAARLRPRWVVWENVPGVLSADKGRAFGLFLGLLGECGYRYAYRVCDARYFGVPQRRARVFVVGYLGTDWRPPAAVLLERDSLRRDLETGDETGKVTPSLTSSGAGVSRVKGAARSDDLEWVDVVNEATIAHTLRAAGHDASEDGTGRGTPLVVANTLQANSGGVQTEKTYIPVAFTQKDSGSDLGHDIAPTLRSMNERGANQNGGGQIAVAFDVAQITSATNRTRAEPGLPTSTMSANSRMHVAQPTAVRRLTPRECERLMGIPDDYTLVPDPRRKGKLAADQPRYHALGNSFAVPVVRWIGERIAAVDAILGFADLSKSANGDLVRNDHVVVGA